MHYQTSKLQVDRCYAALVWHFPSMDPTNMVSSDTSDKDMDTWDKDMEKDKGTSYNDKDKASWCTNGGDFHDWKRWHHFTPVKNFLFETVIGKIEIYYKFSGQKVSLRTPGLRLLQEMLVEVRNCGDHLQWVPRDWAQAMVIDHKLWWLTGETRPIAVFCNSWSKS